MPTITKYVSQVFRPLYRLFERLMPGEADQFDRAASLIRLASGELLRGNVETFTVERNGQKIDWTGIRCLAVRRKSVTRKYSDRLSPPQHAIEYLDTGIFLTASSTGSEPSGRRPRRSASPDR